MVQILGTIDSSGYLLLDNYTIGNEGESGATEIIISIDKGITKQFKSFFIEGTLPNNGTYTSKRLDLTSDGTIKYTVSSGLTRYAGLVDIKVVAYNDSVTKWKTPQVTVRVKEDGGSDKVNNNDALYELYNNVITKSMILDASAEEVCVSSDLLSHKIGDKVVIGDKSYVYGESAFAYISDAVRSPNRVVKITSGTYTEIVNVLQEGIKLVGVGDVEIKGCILFSNANNAGVSNLAVTSTFSLMDDEHECCQGAAIKVIGASFENFIIDKVTTRVVGSGYGIDTASSAIRGLVIQKSDLAGGQYRDGAICDSVRVGVLSGSSILENSMTGRLSFDDNVDDVLVSDNKLTAIGTEAISFTRKMYDSVSIVNNLIYGDEITSAIVFDRVDSADLDKFKFVSNDVSYNKSLVNVDRTIEINPDKFIFANNMIKKGNDSEYFTGDDVGLVLGDGNIISGTGGIDNVEIAGVTLTKHGTELVMSKEELVSALGLTELAFTDPEDVKVDIDLSTVAQLDENGKIKDENIPDDVVRESEIAELIPDDIATKQDVENAVAGCLNEEQVQNMINDSIPTDHVTETQFNEKTSVIEGRVDNIESEISSLKSADESTNSEIDSMKSSIGVINTHLSSINDRVGSNESAISEINTKIATNESDISKNTSDIALNGVAIDTLSKDVESLELDLVCNITDATAATVGKLEAGSTVNGCTLKQIITMMLFGVTNPELIDPSVTVELDNSKGVMGQSFSATATVTFDRGKITPAFGTSGYRSGELDYFMSAGKKYTTNVIPITISSLNAGENKVAILAYYKEGEQPLNSLGAPSGSALPAGSISAFAVVTGLTPVYSGNTNGDMTYAEEIITNDQDTTSSGIFETTDGSGYQICLTNTAPTSGTDYGIVLLPASVKLVGVKFYDPFSSMYKWIGDSQEASLSQYTLEVDDNGDPVVVTQDVNGVSVDYHRYISVDIVADVQHRLYTE